MNKRIDDPAPPRRQGEEQPPADPPPDGAAGKLVVVGPAEAGKSTLIAALCKRSMNLEVHGRTVAMDHGMLCCGERWLSVVGVPGQGRFGAVQRTLAARARGAIWVRRRPWLPDPQTLSLVRDLDLPYVLFLNQLAGEESPSFDPGRESPVPRAVVYGDLLDPRRSGLPELERRIAELLA